VAEGEFLIGIVARIDPMKDHDTFLRAAAVLATTASSRFVVVGTGHQDDLRHLGATASRLGIDTQVVWAGAREDMSAVYSAIDIVTSSSAFGEGFSNSLAEAMACETICVATDVGDSRSVLADTGEVVPPRDPGALATAWGKILAMTPQARRELGFRARVRIMTHFTVDILARRTEEALRSVASVDAIPT
jgi:glycosyltransferase involved in cell wall biosynthesis